jgi:DNA topoisomerase-1
VARGLSAGRCQTPALKLLVEREETIQTFTSTSSWRVQGTWTVAGATSQPQGQALFASLVDSLEAEEDALTYLENRKNQPTLVVHSTTTRPWTAKPPPPLMTSTLQQQASALFGMSPKATMSIAQKLYEAGHITYMRTDTTALSAEATAEARAWVTTNHGPDFLGPGDLKPTKGPKAPGDLKEGPKAQEAHEAIRPTHMELEEVDTEGGQRLYTLIRNRTLQSVMAAARGETCTVILHAPDETEEEILPLESVAEQQILPWSMTQKRTTFEGWRRQGGGVAVLEEDETADEQGSTFWTAVSALEKGHVLTWATLQASPHDTKPPGRMTEAILVRELEQKGIGRPSTFSSLIATVQDRGYATLTDVAGTDVALTTYSLPAPSAWPPTKTTTTKKVGQERKKLVPTPLGLSALVFLEKHFSHLFAYSFTSGMETRLDQVEQGTYAWKQVLRDTWSTYRDTYTTLRATGAANPKIKELGTDGLKAVLSKKGPLLLRGTTKEDTVFYGWPSGLAFSDITEETARAFLAEAAAAAAAVEVWNDHPLVRKTGPHGPYVRWNGTTLSVKSDESLESIKERLTAKTTVVAGATGPLKTFKDYVIRSGPYGPYILKPALKKPQFVSVPKTVTIDTLTESEVAALYTQGLAAKKRFKKT